MAIDFSFLLPTRERTALCIKSIKSLKDLCKDISSFEVLLAFDDDDQYQDILDFCAAEGIRHKHIVTKRYGYRRLHAYINKLCEIAEGERLWLWNDDCYMETQDWDDITRQVVSQYPDYVFDFKNNHFHFIFPLVPKKYVDVMGHYSLNAHNDTWMLEIFKTLLKLTAYTDLISIFHNRGDQENKMGIDYQPINKVWTSETHPDFFSDLGKCLRIVDANRIIRAFFSDRATEFAIQPTLRRRVGFVGMGKLGLPVAVGMAARGHHVVGYDVNPDVNDYSLPHEVFTATEAGPDGTGSIEDLLKTTPLRFLSDLAMLVEFSEIIFLAVQTPHAPKYEGVTRLPDERVDFDYQYLDASLKQVTEICTRLKIKRTVVVISTVLPGTMEKLGYSRGSEYVNICYNPYFIAMGTVLRDFYDPEFILLGSNSGDEVTDQVKSFYNTICRAPVYATTVENAELIKVSYNTMISMKIAFVNQLMEICDKTPNTNVDDVTDALKMANRRLISPAYLTGGMGDGGGCHPRDNIAMSWLARKLNLRYDFCESIMLARERQTDFLADLCEQYADQHKLNIVVLGRAFKPNIKLSTGSPAVLLYNILQERGRKVEIMDPLADDNFPNTVGVSVFFIGVRHDIFERSIFPAGSVVIDPHRYIKQQQGVTVHYVGVGPKFE